MQITSQDLGPILEPAKTKTDLFMKAFVTIIMIVIEFFIFGVVTNIVILNNPTLDPTIQALLVIFPILLAIGIVFVIWKADVLYDNKTVF